MTAIFQIFPNAFFFKRTFLYFDSNLTFKAWNEGNFFSPIGHKMSLGHNELTQKVVSMPDRTSYEIALTQWSWVTHICVSELTIIGSENGLAPGRRQAIISIDPEILLIGLLGANFSEILIEIHIFSFKKIHMNTFGKWRTFCLCLNVKSWIDSHKLIVQPYIISLRNFTPAISPWHLSKCQGNMTPHIPLYELQDCKQILQYEYHYLNFQIVS